jgi:uncharacterized protein
MLLVAFIIIFITAFIASVIAFLSGFGFLTLVMPVLALFLPIPLAIAITALAHLIHTIVKLLFTVRFINYHITLRFGLVALLFAIPGTFFLRYISTLEPLYTYHIASVPIHITLLKITVGIILLLVVAMENRKQLFNAFRTLFPCAAISGFIGGLTGNQGAFRSLFLINQGLDIKTYIATGAAISLIVDVVRLVFYMHLFPTWDLFLPDVLPALLGSLFGALLGMSLMKKIKIHHIRGLVLTLLYICGFAFLVGLI